MHLPACREEAVKASAIQAVLERREVSRKLCCTGTRNRGAGGIANFLGCTQHARGCFKVTTVDLCAIPYDHLAAAAKAAREGREDWAEALRSGRNG